MKLPTSDEVQENYKSQYKSTKMEYEDRVPQLMRLILIERLSFNEFCTRVKNDYNVTKRTGATWWKDVRERLKERYVEASEEVIYEQIQRYFDLYKQAEKRGNTRVMREILADLNKLYGLEKPAKLDVTSGGEKIKINIVLASSNDDK